MGHGKQELSRSLRMPTVGQYSSLVVVIRRVDTRIPHFRHVGPRVDRCLEYQVDVKEQV